MWILLTFMVVCISAHQVREGDIDMTSLNKLGLADNDITAMFRMHNAIEKPLHKTDCFLRVSTTIRGRCNQDHMPEDERIHAAISMTLCELATANYQSPPLECAPFSLDAQTAGMVTTHRLQRDCVEALSRSAQFWSSYSGYLREIPQLCFVFGRWNDIDLARDVYRNATLEKVMFLQHIFKREQVLQAQMSTWSSGISELKNVASSMATFSQEISLLFGNADSRLQDALFQLVSLHTKAFDQYLIEREAKDLGHISQINASLSQLHDRHIEQLHMIVPHFRMTLQEQLGPIFSGVRVMHDLLVTLQNELQKEWVDAIDKLGNMHGLLSNMQHGINASLAAISSLDKEVVSLQNKHSKMSATAEDLHDTIASITTSTSLELQKINITVHSIGSTFDALSYGDYWPLAEDIVYRVLSYFWLADSPELNNRLYRQVLRIVLKILHSIVRALLSTIVGLPVLVYSSRKYLRRFFAESPAESILHRGSDDTPRRMRINVSRIPDRLYRR